MLVLMSDGYPYDQFRSIWRKYMKSHPNIDCYFYQGNMGLLTEYKLTEDTLWIRTSNSFQNIFHRTLLAFRYFVNMRPNTYSFVFRPNASCIVNFNKYYEMCKSFPTQNFCSAEILRRGEVIEHPVVEAPSGAGYTLSIDLVKRFAREQGLKNVLIDDISVGYYLQEWKIPITPALMYKFERREYSPEEVMELLSKHFHFRFRTSSLRDKNRDWDIGAMNSITNILYGKK
jgi:hypothetical protein